MRQYIYFTFTNHKLCEDQCFVNLNTHSLSHKHLDCLNQVIQSIY